MSTVIQQFRSERGCLSYIVSDDKSKEALIIDPSVEVDDQKYLGYLEEHGFFLKYIIETHTHADHISSGEKLRENTGAKILQHPSAQSSKKDEDLPEGEIELGNSKLHILYTPGHTDDSISVVTEDSVFTGDTLLIGGTGRTDFQAGSSEDLHSSLWGKIMKLPDDTIVYPGHNYKNQVSSTIGKEKESNMRITLKKEEFVSIMDAHHPPKPELFDEAIEKNSK